MNWGLPPDRSGGLAALRTPEKIQDLSRYADLILNPMGTLSFSVFTHPSNTAALIALKAALLRPAPS